MSHGLATRCSACGTVFRVVADQLRVSEGWVRCGRCTQVFNALESLVDLDTGMPRRDGSIGPPGSADAGAAMQLDVAHPAARPGTPPLPPVPATVDAADLLAREFASTSAPDTRPPQASDTLASSSIDTPASQAGPLVTDAAAAPSFIRQADRAARWRRPGVRAALAGLALLSAVLLAAQAAHTWRDRLAARVPAAAPWLAQSCVWLGCTVGPAREIHALSVESSGLVRVERSNLYRLQVSLRNQAGHPVSVPALDLTLTDARGELVARRVLRPAELGESAATIGPGRELALQGTLQAGPSGGEARVIAGYTVEIFYP